MRAPLLAFLLASCGALAARAEGPVDSALVVKAIDAGVKGLLGAQQADGSWSASDLFPPHLRIASPRPAGGREGVTAIALLALLASDVKPDHPAIKRGFDRLFVQRAERAGRVQPGGIVGVTYDEGVVCMALHAWSHAFAKAKNKGREPPEGRKCHLSSRAKAWLAEVASDLAESRTTKAAWGYQTRRARAALGEGGDTRVVAPPDGGPDRAMPGGSDNDRSNTQYAILGLRAAELCGFVVRGSLWQDVLEDFLRGQGGRGDPLQRAPEMSGGERPTTPRGWGYRAGEGATMTMTCAGVAAVIIAREQLAFHRAFRAEDEEATRSSIADGFAWIGQSYTHTGSSGPGQDPRNRPNRAPANEEIDGYLLYGLERAGVLGDVVKVGQHTWYDEGAAHLLERQLRSGLWHGMHGDSVETAFALLFLKRATRPVAVELTGNAKEE